MSYFVEYDFLSFFLYLLVFYWKAISLLLRSYQYKLIDSYFIHWVIIHYCYFDAIFAQRELLQASSYVPWTCPIILGAFPYFLVQ